MAFEITDITSLPQPFSNHNVILHATTFLLQVEQNQSGTYYQIVYTPSGSKMGKFLAGTIQQLYVPLPGGASAEYLSWGLSHYRHSDWLASNRLESDAANHSIKDNNAYAPFGEPYAQTGNGEISFTGQNKDTVWLQYDFLARQYDPKQGRWLSPDPAGLGAVNAGNPQSWNMYAYVANQPLTSFDPSGLATQTTPQQFLDASWLASRDPGLGTSGCFLDGAPMNCNDPVFSGQAAVACPQCKPGQSVGMDGKMYGWIDSYILSTGSISDCPNSDDPCASPDLTYTKVMGHFGVVGSIAEATTDPFLPMAQVVFQGNRGLWSAAAGTMNKATVAYAAAFAGVAAIGTVSSLETMQVAIGTVDGNLHVAFGVNGTWMHAIGDTLGDMFVTTHRAAQFAEGAFQFSLPILNSTSVLPAAGTAASSCLSAACNAFLSGW